jgi:hypothetical protein
VGTVDVWQSDGSNRWSWLLIYIEHVEKEYYLSRQYSRYTIVHRQRPSRRFKALTDRQRLELAEDSREPPETITVLHGKLVAKARISQWQRGRHPRMC